MAREMKEHELASPVDLPAAPADDRRPFAWTFATIVVAALGLLCANAGTLSAWIDEQPPSELQLRASDLAGRWAATMDAAGITAPRRTLHIWWKQAQAARFGGEAPASGS